MTLTEFLRSRIARDIEEFDAARPPGFDDPIATSRVDGLRDLLLKLDELEQGHLSAFEAEMWRARMADEAAQNYSDDPDYDPTWAPTS